MARDDSVAISTADAIAHCQQAEEYLRAAEYSLEIGDLNAAAGTAIDAGINAADAVAGVNLGLRAVAAATDGETPGWASMGVAELVDHLEATHHRTRSSRRRNRPARGSVGQSTG